MVRDKLRFLENAALAVSKTGCKQILWGLRKMHARLLHIMRSRIGTNRSNALPFRLSVYVFEIHTFFCKIAWALGERQRFLIHRK